MNKTLGIGLLFFAVLIGIGLTYRVLIWRAGLTVTSWWRFPQKNRDVGGKANSLHMVGLAWDVLPVTKRNENLLRDMGLTVVNEGDHLHSQVNI